MVTGPTASSYWAAPRSLCPCLPFALGAGCEHTRLVQSLLSADDASREVIGRKSLGGRLPVSSFTTRGLSAGAALAAATTAARSVEARASRESQQEAFPPNHRGRTHAHAQTTKPSTSAASALTLPAEDAAAGRGPAKPSQATPSQATKPSQAKPSQKDRAMPDTEKKKEAKPSQARRRKKPSQARHREKNNRALFWDYLIGF